MFHGFAEIEDAQKWLDKYLASKSTSFNRYGVHVSYPLNDKNAVDNDDLQMY